MNTASDPENIPPTAPPGPGAGVYMAAGAFLIWGLSPVYWKALGAVPAFEILMHRIVWSFLFLLPMLAGHGRWQAFRQALASGRTVRILLFSTLLVGGNWFLYIWAIQHAHVLQTSMGYYITPLVNVVLGVVFLRERLRRLQVAALVLAALGVIYLTASYGQFPWISLVLAVSFGVYGLVRKVAPVGPLVGLAVETLLLSIPATVYLIHLGRAGLGAFGRLGMLPSLLLVGSALVTAFPLLLFTRGTKLLHLSTIGFLQYIAPSCTFLLAVFVFREPVVPAQFVTFGLIWAALAIYSWDSLVFLRRHRRPLPG